MTDQEAKKRALDEQTRRFAKPEKTWGDVFNGHIKASKGLMDHADAAYRADLWAARKSAPRSKPAKCPTCDGTGQIDGGSDQGDTWNCPDCLSGGKP